MSLDVQDDILLCFLCAIAFFYLKVTGPYWKLVNSNVITYSQFHVHIQKMHSVFQELLDQPHKIFDHDFKSVFGDELQITSPTWDSVHEFVFNHDSALICGILKVLISECALVLQRQLCDFLPGGCLASPNDIVKKQIDHCPLTNLIGESAFGDLDFDYSKRRNASTHNRSVLHSVKRNKTVQNFLNTKSVSKQKKLFAIARSKAPIFRKQQREQEEAVKNCIRQKFLENQDRKIKKAFSDMSKSDSITANVEAHGGPCKCSADVQDLFVRLTQEGLSKTKMVECFKNEIKYQKAVFGKKLKFGELMFMVESLKKCFDDSPSPPSKRRKL